MGQALREMKGLMPHGAFEAWYAKELGLNRKQVSDYMCASEALESLPPDTPLVDAAPRQLAILSRGGPKALSKATALMIAKGSVTEKDARQIANGDDAEEKPKPPNATQRIATLIDQNGLLMIENDRLKKQLAAAELEITELKAKLGDGALEKQKEEEEWEGSVKEPTDPAKDSVVDVVVAPPAGPPDDERGDSPQTEPVRKPAAKKKPGTKAKPRVVKRKPTKAAPKNSNPCGQLNLMVEQLELVKQ